MQSEFIGTPSERVKELADASLGAERVSVPAGIVTDSAPDEGLRQFLHGF